jgi:hypothetical protein
MFDESEQQHADTLKIMQLGGKQYHTVSMLPSLS